MDRLGLMIAKPTPRPKVRKPLKSRPQGINPYIRETVFRRDEYTCAWCKVPGGHLDPHHILPRGRGGQDRIDNLVALHRLCHSYIHDHPAEGKRKGFLA
jgi:5-methylcytosine-specific restriction endonuclease McrA